MKILLACAGFAFLGAAQAAAPPPRPPILGIAHVAIQTSDLVKARAFYGDLLGLPEQQPPRPHAAIFIVNARQRLIVHDGLPADRDERFIRLAFDADATAMRQFLIGRAASVDEPHP